MIRQPKSVLIDAGHRLQVEHLDAGAGEQVVDLPADPPRVVGRGAREPFCHDALEGREDGGGLPLPPTRSPNAAQRC
jgi:hypothetical protein